MNDSFKEKCTILVIISAIIIVSLSSGCLSSSDEVYYEPRISAHFDSLDLSSLADTLKENNISFTHSTDYQLNIDIFTNSSYTFSNVTYNITASSISLHDSLSYDPWMTLRLHYNVRRHYRFKSEEAAKEAMYLLEPSLELLSYFLEESGNPLPYEVSYFVEDIY